ncbi:unnamed protein product [Diamesa serratosioi]
MSSIKNKIFVDWSLPFVIPIVSTLVILVLVHLYQTTGRMAKLANQLPGPKTLPFIGNAHIALGLKSNHHAFKRAMSLSEKYGKVIRGWIGPKLIIFLMDPQDVEIILNSQVHIDKSDEYNFFRPWLGNGILISSGDSWRKHRKIIAPAFHQNVLKTFISIFYENSKIIVDKMNEEIGSEIDCHDYMSEATVNILLETAMGYKNKSSGPTTSSGYNYAMAVMRMCDIIHQRHYKIHLRLDAFFNLTKLRKIQKESLAIIHGLTKSVLKSKQEIFNQDLKQGNLPSPTLEEIIKEDSFDLINQSNPVSGLRDDLDDIDENDVGEKRRLAFLDLMIETAHYTKQLTDQEIKEQVDTIMFEGHDTTAAGSSFVLCMLGVHQDIQEKVMQEQRQIFGGSDRDPTFADTIDMKYLERVILETLRLYPPVPIIARKVYEDVKLNTKDYIIPAGATVVIGTFKIHRDPKLYPNPLNFNPDNFLPENTQNRHYYGFIPFSAGPRSCVGRKYAILKLKVLLSTILRSFHIKSSCTEKDFKLIGDIILKRADGFRIIVEPRS